MTTAEALVMMQTAPIFVAGDVANFALGALGLALAEVEGIVRRTARMEAAGALWHAYSGEYQLLVGLGYGAVDVLGHRDRRRMTMATAKCTYPVGPWTFTAVFRSEFPEKPLFAAAELMRLERAIARHIVEHGLRSPETLRFLRGRAGLTASALADLIGTSVETVSRWENGRGEFSAATWYTVASLAMDADDGRDSAEWLRAALAPPAPAEVAVEI